jgi:hypothetical protein
MTEHRIQDFAVIGGAIARNDEGLIEGRLLLTGDVTLVFVMDKDGARWHWQPEDPTFAATRLGMFGSDTDQPGAEELQLLAEHGVAAMDFARLQILDIAQDDLNTVEHHRSTPERTAQA